MKKLFLFQIIILSLIFISGCKKEIKQTTEVITGIDAVKKKVQADKDIALIQARTLFRQAQIDQIDLNNGPCLSNNLIKDWVLDIAHNPRQPIDNQPENQCESFRNGQTHHFVEMDENGNIIEIY